MSSSFLADVGIRAVDAGLPAARPKVSAQPLESGRIWVARHGERADAADATWEQTAERPFDPPLTPLGFLQAEATGDALCAEPSLRVEAIFTSPFLRCVQTASAIASRLGGVPLRVEPGLSEWLNPSWFPEGIPIDGRMSTSELARAVEDGPYGSEVVVDQSYAPLWDAPSRGAELGDGVAALTFPEANPLDAMERYTAVLASLQAASPFSVVVTHGFGVQAIVEACGAELFECDYCALSRLRRAEPADSWRCDVICRATHTEALRVAGGEPVEVS